MAADTQLRAADTLLENGVVLQCAAPFFLKCFGKKTIKLTLYPPVFATLVKIARLWLKMGVKEAELSKLSVSDKMQLLNQHGANCVRIVALCMVKDTRKASWLNGYLARYLARRLRAKDVLLLTEIVVLQGGVEDFCNTIALGAKLNILSPKASQITPMS